MAEDAVPNFEEVPVVFSWVPATPEKPSRKQLICTNGQVQHWVQTSFLDMERDSQVTQENLFEIDILPGEVVQGIHPERETVCSSSENLINVDRDSGNWKEGGATTSCVQTNHPSVFETAKDAHFHVQRGCLCTKDKFSLDDANNMPFLDLLALAHSREIRLGTINPEPDSTYSLRGEDSIDELPVGKDAEGSKIMGELHGSGTVSETLSTHLQENHKSDKGGADEVNSIRTPQPKPRRKKHRPKVVIDAQQKRTPKNADKATVLQEPKSKKKYVGRKVLDDSFEGGNIQDDMNEKASSSTSTPVQKRMYARTQGMDLFEGRIEKGTIGTTDMSPPGRLTRNSCRRSLNFDKAIHENSSYFPPSNCDLELQAENFNRKDPLETVLSKKLKDVQMETNDISTSPEFVSNRGKFQVVISNSTHDKEEHAVEMKKNVDGQTAPESPTYSIFTCLDRQIQVTDLRIQYTDSAIEEQCNRDGAFYNSPMLPQNEYTDYSPALYFPHICKRKRTEKGNNLATSSWQSTESTVYNHMKLDRHGLMDSCTSLLISTLNQGPAGAQSEVTDVPTNQVNLLASRPTEKIKSRRSKCSTPLRDSASLPAPPGVSATMTGTKQDINILRSPDTCMEALVAGTHQVTKTKKRSRRSMNINSTEQNLYGHQNATTSIGTGKPTYATKLSYEYISDTFTALDAARPLDLTWKHMSHVDSITEQLDRLHLNGKNKNASVLYDFPSYSAHYQEQHALVPFQTYGAVVPFDRSFESVRRKPRPKVDLDDETTRVWKLLLENINSEGIDGTDEAKAKWWEGERRVFKGRADSFIARMHLVQGDRRFSPWKGSVVDSVVGVFLTQNVSDHLSSSAFMSIAARFPVLNTAKIPTEELHEMGRVNKIEDPEVCLHDLDGNFGLNTEILDQPARGEDAKIHPCFKIDRLTGVARGNFVNGYTKEDDIAGQSAETSKCGSQTSCEAVTSKQILFSQAPDISSHNSANSPIAEVTDRSGSCSELSNAEISGLSSESSVDNTFFQTAKAVGSRVPKFSSSKMVSSNNDQIDIIHSMAKTQSQSLRDVTGSSKNMDSNKSYAYYQHGMAVDDGLRAKSRNRKSKENHVNWDDLRKQALAEGRVRPRTDSKNDSVDWDAVRCADVHEIADTIKERGMNNILAQRIKDFLNRLVQDHESIDLEWLRDIPPDKAKEYLLSVRGLGLKSVECVRLLTLHHLAFPVDTNVGRIAVRLGWVPLQPLPESLQLHLLELYPVLESIQKYLWPRLCKLDQRTLYELHYQMITFGKVFCTKSKPNCNACPMRAECRHFASAFASSRLALPAPEGKRETNATYDQMLDRWLMESTNTFQLSLTKANQLDHRFGASNSQPIIEEPLTPEPIIEMPVTPEPANQLLECDIEDFVREPPDEIPTIQLNMDELSCNVQKILQRNAEFQEADMSKALVALTSEAASIPVPKLKNVSRLRTEHRVYELPDSHPLLEEMDKRESDDPSPYLLAIWTPGEIGSSDSKKLCSDESCSACNSIRETNSQTVRGTILIPCRTAMRGSFPLNGTYFQVNEVFSDHESSLSPIAVPRKWLWNLPRRTVFFGTSIPTIFKGLTTEGIQYCFWRGFVCVRGFERKTRAPRPLLARFHFPVSKSTKSKGKTDEA